MLTLKNSFSGESVEFENSTQLKEFLQMQNPTMLKRYKEQLAVKQPKLVVDGIGTVLRIYKK